MRLRVGPVLRCIWLLVVCVSLQLPTNAPTAAAPLPAPTPLPTTTLLGIAAHAWWLDPYREQSLTAYADLGVQVVRIGIDWKRVEAVKGTYDWSLYDRTLPALAARRIAIVANLNSFPVWTSVDPLCANRYNEPLHCLPRSDAIESWDRFAAAAAARYPFIERWELWNEPELWAGTHKQDQYLAYVRRAYRDIHAANPQARVAISSLLGWIWVRELYALTTPADRPWDAVAYHPYPIPGGIQDDNPDQPIDTERITELRRGMTEHGHGAAPIWITEFGFSKPPEEQAYRLQKTLAFFATRADIELVCLHALHDWDEDAPSPRGYGLMAANPRPTEENPPPTRFTPKEPFYSTFKHYPRSAPPPPPDTPAQRFFAATNQVVRDPVLTYWNTHGGLALFGLPLSDLFWERLDDGRWYRVQYFERARFELHPEQDAPYDLLLGQFGRRFHPLDPPAETLPDARYFAETGHNLTDEFRDYWESNGGLAQFGFPLSEVISERLEDGRAYQVQYFERARFEYHPENPPPNTVLLGQFGRRVLAER